MSHSRKIYFNWLTGVCVIFLTGCSVAFLFPYPIAIEDIPWGEPKDLRLDNCPVIDGVYSIIPQGRDRENNELSNLFDAPYKKIISMSDNPLEYAKPKKEGGFLEFEVPPLMVIRIENNTLSATEINSSGKRFSTSVVHFSPTVDLVDHARGQDWRVGCLEGAYITRSVFSYASSEGSDQARSWTEKRIWKLPDGNIQISATSCRYRQFDKIRCNSIKSPYIFSAYNGQLGEIIK